MGIRTRVTMSVVLDSRSSSVDGPDLETLPVSVCSSVSGTSFEANPVPHVVANLTEFECQSPAADARGNSTPRREAALSCQDYTA